MQVNQWQAHFNNNAKGYRAGPVENRTCNDWCCYVFFVLMLFAFIVIGAYMINDQRNAIFSYNGQGSNGNTQSSTSVIASDFTNYYQLIIGCFGLAFILSVIYLVLVRAFPKCMIYSMIFLVFFVLTAVLVIALVELIWGLAIGIGVLLLIMICFLWCFRQHIETGILLLKVAATFLSEKPSVYIAAIWVFFLSLLFFVFWLVGIAAIQNSSNIQQQNNASTSKQTGFFAYFIVVYVFMTYFLYYVLVFLISTACAFWYYDIQDNYCCTGTGWINKYHIGSITFGAILVTIVRIIKTLIQEKSQDQFQNGNACVGILLCCLACLISQIQALLQVLNHNTVIVMAVTGESYLDSAKTAMSIIFENFGLFNTVQTITFLIFFGGILVCVGIPTLIGILIAKYAYARPPTSNELVSLGLIIFFISILLVIFMISILSEALSCVFIYYCLDKRMRQVGINVPNSPLAIQQFLDFQGGRMQEMMPPPTNQEILRPQPYQGNNQPQYYHNQRPYQNNGNPYQY